MQIHEITLAGKINEGVLGDIARSVTAPLAKSSSDAILQKQTQKYVQDLSRKWAEKAKTLPAPQATPAATTTSTSVPQPITTPSGQIISKPGDPSYAELAKKAGLTEADDADTLNAYKQAFTDWAEQQLRTTESRTKKPIGLNDVMALPGMKLKLESALDRIAASRTNPQELDTAVQNYLTLAINGTQAIAKDIRANAPVTRQQKTIRSTGDSAKDALLKRDGWIVTV
jgi:hypothetical protein